MQTKYVFSKTFKKIIFTVTLQHYKITQKSTPKNFIKTFPTYFFTNFFQHLSNRPYPNVKIIPAYFYTIKFI